MKRLTYWKNLMVCMILALMLIACSQRNTITGYIEGLSNDEMVLVNPISLDKMEELETDTIFPKNGRFEYTFPKDGAYIFRFMFSQFFVSNRPTGGRYTPDNSSLVVFTEPGERISIRGGVNQAGLSNISITGSTLNQDHSIIQNQLFEIKTDECKEEMALEQAIVDGNKEAEEIGWTLRHKRNKAARQPRSNYINQNPDNPLSAYLLCNQPLDSIGKYHDKLGENARNSIFRHLLDRKIGQYNDYIIATNAKEELIVGSKVPDFTLEDIHGNPFRLSSLQEQAKYIIIDFWGSWCGACITGFPQMKRFYEKHKDKLEIVGVACHEPTIDSWQEAVKQHNLPWINVYDSSKVRVKYGIMAYPTKIVIDSEGTILLLTEGNSDDFYTKLECIIQ